MPITLSYPGCGPDPQIHRRQTEERGESADIGERRDEHGRGERRIHFQRLQPERDERAGRAGHEQIDDHRQEQQHADRRDAPVSSPGAERSHKSGGDAVADADQDFLSSAFREFAQVSSPSASPRTMTVSVCVAALPPMPGTIGMNFTSAHPRGDRRVEQCDDTRRDERGHEIDEQPRETACAATRRGGVNTRSSAETPASR